MRGSFVTSRPATQHSAAEKTGRFATFARGETGSHCTTETGGHHTTLPSAMWATAMPSFGMLRHVALVKNRRFGGTYRLHHVGDKNRRARNNVSSN
jgi:hypothetical protein